MFQVRADESGRPGFLPEEIIESKSMRIVLLFLILALLFAIPFILFGERFEQWFSGDGAVKWLRSYGAWAWVMALGLLVADLVAPVPATAVMAGLGMLYGPLAGGLIGAAGSILSGMIAYAVCRKAGRRAARMLAGEKDLARAESFFARSGGWAVAFSRWAPLLPEVIACLAGLARMPFAPFILALACGTLPMTFVFAWIGHLGVEKPVLALCASAVVPLLLWAALRRLIKKEPPRTGPGAMNDKALKQ